MIRIGSYDNRRIEVLEIIILTNLTHSFYQGLIEVALQDYSLEHILRKSFQENTVQ